MGLSFLIAMVVPLYGGHVQPFDHRPHTYSCESVSEMPAERRVQVGDVTSHKLPAYEDFCDSFVSAAVADVEAGSSFMARLMPSWDAKLDAAVKKAQIDAAEAYSQLQSRYWDVARKSIGELTSGAQPDGSLQTVP